MSSTRFPSWLGGFALGLGLACQSGEVSNPGHCFNNTGDSYCVERHGDDQPYCLGDGESCPTADSIDGCVAELPDDECYSPCGDGALLADDDSCLTGGESTGDGDGDGEPGPACGDAALDDDEECDDGNTVDDDDCTNACTTPRCGDAVVQAQLGEACDDGNTVGGDGCAANCMVSGTLLWSVGGDPGYGAAVAVAQDGTIGVLVGGGPGPRVIAFDGAGEQLWTQPSLDLSNDLAAGSDGSFVVAGAEDGSDQGLLRAYGPDGQELWTAAGSMFSSTVRALATDQAGNIVSVGDISGVAYIARHSAVGELGVEFALPDSNPLRMVAAGVDGSLWTMTGEPNQISHYDPTNIELWTTAPLESPIASPVDLSVSPGLETYVVGNGDIFESIGVGKYDPDGGLVWASVLDHPTAADIAGGIVVLPSGGVVVVGLSSAEGQQEAVGLIAWFDQDGELAGDYMYDRQPGVDQDIFYSAAVAPDGNVVVVGAHQPDGGETELWLLELAI